MSKCKCGSTWGTATCERPLGHDGDHLAKSGLISHSWPDRYHAVQEPANGPEREREPADRQGSETGRLGDPAGPGGIGTGDGTMAVPPKPPLRLLGRVHRAVVALVRQMAWGDAKHRDSGPIRSPEDWAEKAQRHLLAYQSGVLLDEDGRPHLVGAMTDLVYAVQATGEGQP